MDIRATLTPLLFHIMGKIYFFHQELQAEALKFILSFSLII